MIVDTMVEPTSMKLRISTQSVLVAVAVLHAGVAAAANLSGSVTSTDGKPIQGAEIMISGLGKHQTSRTDAGKAVSRPVEGAEPGRATVRLRPDGTFSIQGLRNGEYLVCARAPFPYLNPCDWGTPGGFRVDADRVSGGVSLRLQTGALLEIRIDDPARAFPQADDSVNGLPISCGVMTPDRRYVPALLSSRTPEGRTYRLAVPAATNLKLSFSSRVVRLVQGTVPMNYPHGLVELPPQQVGGTYTLHFAAQPLSAAEKEKIRFQ